LYEFKLPDLGEGLSEGEIVRWNVKEGDNVKEDQNVLEIETAKAIVEIPTPKSGTINQIFFKEGNVVKVGEVLFSLNIKESKIDILPESKLLSPVKKISERNFSESTALATPKVRKLARELQVDINSIKPTRVNNRITEEDLRNYVGLSKSEESLPIERIKLHSIRREIAEKITKSAFNIPHATVMHDAIVTKLVEFRERIKQLGLQKGIKVTYLPLILKAVVLALEKYPYFNSTLSLDTNEIIVKKYFNIGIAVDTPYGVVVPVIKFADKKDIFELAKEMEFLSGKARNRQLTIADVSGGTFTVTNVGAVGSKLSTPIINYPECAILAIHRITDSVVVVDNKITIQKVMPMAITFDHRIVDGAQTARFMNEVIRLLERPEWMEGDL
jgi:pyruvate dehydrogenase E2 component (dihydrolipoamide acetyltransferase)